MSINKGDLLRYKSLKLKNRNVENPNMLWNTGLLEVTDVKELSDKVIVSLKNGITISFNHFLDNHLSEDYVEAIDKINKIVYHIYRKNDN